MFEKYKDKPDMIFDGGKIAKNKPSTVVKILDDGTLEIIRKGAIKL